MIINNRSPKRNLAKSKNNLALNIYLFTVLKVDQRILEILGKVEWLKQFQICHFTQSLIKQFYIIFSVLFFKFYYQFKLIIKYFIIQSQFTITIGSSSGCNASVGVTTAFIAALTNGFFSGSNHSIYMPSWVVIGLNYQLVKTYGVEVMPWITIIVGIYIYIAGLLKWHHLSDFIPVYVIEGFLLGIASLFFFSYSDYMFGLTDNHSNRGVELYSTFYTQFLINNVIMTFQNNASLFIHLLNIPKFDLFVSDKIQFSYFINCLSYITLINRIYLKSTNIIFKSVKYRNIFFILQNIYLLNQFEILIIIINQTIKFILIKNIYTICLNLFPKEEIQIILLEHGLFSSSCSWVEYFLDNFPGF